MNAGCPNERPSESLKPSCGLRGSIEVYRRFKDRVNEVERLRMPNIKWE